MKPKTLFRRMAVLVATMMCALGANADSYACYTPENTTLTFYLDDLRSSRTGTTYDLNLGNNSPGWKNDGINANVTQVVFDPSFAYARPETTYAWFHGMQNLQSITGIRYLNTSQTTSMRWMFYGCSGLTSLDSSRFNTTNVTSMLSMFYGCSALTSLNVSSFNTANVTDIRSMFRNCTGLTSLDLGNFNTANVTSMGNMFNGCTNLTTIYAGSGWTTDAVSQSTDMFSGCTKLVGGKGTTYDANHTDAAYAHIDGGTSNPGYFTGIEGYACYTPSNTTLTFYYDSRRNSRPGTIYDLNTGDAIPQWYTDRINNNVTQVVFDPSFANARPTTTYDWFYAMRKLESITGLSYLNTSEVTNMSFMFEYCIKLTSLDLSHFNTSKVISMSRLFKNCSSLTSLDLSSFNTSQVAYMNWMFSECTNLRTIYVSNGWSTATVIQSVEMFNGCTSLVGGKGTTYDSNHIDKAYAHIDGGTSNPGYLTAASTREAYACYTPSNTTLTFYYDNQRSSRTGTTYDLNTGTNITGWESDGINASVTQVVFDSSFANARPTSTYRWFYWMENLESITGMKEYLNTSAVTNMGCMFNSCTKLTSVDVTRFNTSEVTQMYIMFGSCFKLERLDLSSFNTSKVTDMQSMFAECPNLRTIYVSNGWSTAAVTDSEDMFHNCNSLVGGQGTTYDSNHIDKAYAHIDGGTSNPGYFTAAGTEPYACYTPSNTTLTFYYDNQRSSRSGTTYDLNTGNNIPGWENDGKNASVTQVVFDSSFANARPTSTYCWFYWMENLESITGMEYLNTSKVTNMGCMFNSCIKLTSVDVTHFNTSEVTQMYMMFCSCFKLERLDLSSFNTSKVTDMSNMFSESIQLRTIYVGNGWSTAAVTNSEDMFYNCASLKGGQGTSYNSSYVDKTYAHIDGGASNPGYFTEWKEAYACYTPSNTTLTFYYDNYRSSRTGTTYDLNTGSTDVAWDTDGTNASVTKVVFDPSFAGARPTTTYDWFYDMTNLQSITGLSYLNTSEVTKMGHMFNSCYRLTSLDLSGFSTSRVTTMNCMFLDCRNLQTIYVGTGWSTAAVTNSDNMFSYCTSLVGGQGTTYNASNPKDKTYARIDGGPSNPGYFTEAVTGVATNVEVVPAKANTVKGIYTLDGRKLNELPTKKGVYIVDGRKVVMK